MPCLVTLRNIPRYSRVTVTPGMRRRKSGPFLPLRWTDARRTFATHVREINLFDNRRVPRRDRSRLSFALTIFSSYSDSIVEIREAEQTRFSYIYSASLSRA